MSHDYNLITRCPICKEDTPHDSRGMWNICKVCGVSRMVDCEGAFKKCRCGEFIPNKPAIAVDVDANALVVTQTPLHVCKCICSQVCDCANPPPEGWEGKHGAWAVSEHCPIHNKNPKPSPDCPVHGRG